MSCINVSNHKRGYGGAPKQRGVVLFIALIVLVAMTLAGIGLLRSVDTANVIANNLAFKQASINASDSGIEQAFVWLLNRAGSAELISDEVAEGYYSSAPAQEPDWNNPDVWINAKVLAPDAAGNVVSYVVHRMCAVAGLPASDPNQSCLNDTTNTLLQGCSGALGRTCFAGAANLYYRITTRVQGPHNTVTYVQAMTKLSN